MADKFTAAESIRRLAVMYQDMVAAADALESIGKLEQVTAEHGKAAEKAKKDAEKAKAALAQADDAVLAAKKEADAILADAAAQAKDQGAAIVRAAEEHAAVVLKGGQDKASEMIAQAAAEKARLSSEIGGLQRAIGAAKDELAAIHRARDTAEAATADAEKKLASLKSKLKDLLA